MSTWTKSQHISLQKICRKQFCKVLIFASFRLWSKFYALVMTSWKVGAITKRLINKADSINSSSISLATAFSLCRALVSDLIGTFVNIGSCLTHFLIDLLSTPNFITLFWIEVCEENLQSKFDLCNHIMRPYTLHDEYISNVIMTSLL